MADAVPPKIPSNANGSFPVGEQAGASTPSWDGSLSANGSTNTGAKVKKHYADSVDDHTGSPVAGNGSQAAFELRDSAESGNFVGPDSGPKHVDVGA